jgi:peptidase C39-like protein
VTLLAVAGVVIWVVTGARGGPGPSSGVPGSAKGGLTVQGSPWTTTDNGRREDSFVPGGPIRYAFDVHNSTGRTVSANVRFDAYSGSRDQREVNIFDILFAVTIPSGRMVVRSAPATVPRNALPGTYTEQADIADRANTADHTGQYSSFNIAGKTLLKVPYLTQPGTAQSGGKYDGGACVAMILGSRSSPGQPTVGDVQGFIAASSSGQGASGTAQAVAGEELEFALEHYGVAEAAITQISLDEQGLPQAQMTEIAIAIKHGSPVIVFTDGKDLPAGHTGSRSYTGHWLVVVGFGFDPANGTQVLVNDPDDVPGHGGIRGQPISIGTFEQAMKDAASVPAAQQEPNHIAGIIVAR